MADRKVKVELSARVDGYLKAMKEAAAETLTVDKNVDKLTQRRQAMDLLGKAALGTGAATALGIGLAVAKFAEFDQAMSNVQAATHESADNMELLRQAAIEAGARTVYSASEAAGAIEELAKAGVSTTDIINGGLDGALDLAAAGEIEVAKAAEIAASTMTQFGLAGQDVTHIADLLAAGAGKAQGGVSDLSQALNQSGLVASQMNLSVEETVGTLANFASAGLIGSDAGTSFRNMLLRLANPTKEAAGQMEQLGLNFYDAQGEFIGMEGVAGQLQTRLAGLTTEERNAALANLFGQDAIRSAAILYEGGADSVREWTAAVDDSGYASETAATRLDNLKGDWEAFTGALDTALITIGEGADGPLRALVQSITGVVDAFNSMPDWLQQGTMWATGAVGGIVGIGGAAVFGVPKVLEFTRALDDLNLGGARLRNGMGNVARFMTGPWGVALGGAVAIVALLASEHQKGEQRARSYADTLDETTGAVTDATASMVADMLTAERGFMGWSKTIADMAKEADVDLGTVADAIMGNADAYAELEAAAARMTKETGSDRNWATSLKDAVDEQIGSMERAQEIHGQVKDAIDGSTEANAEGAEGASAAGDAYSDEAGAVGDLNSQLDELIAKLMESNDANSDAITAQSTYKDVLADVEEQVGKIAAGEEGYARTLDLSTEAGRDNMGMLQRQASTSQDLAEKQLALDGNTSAYIQRLRDGRATFIENARRFGATKAEAEKLADQIYQIPSEKEVEILAKTQQAMTNLRKFAGELWQLPSSKTVQVNYDQIYSTRGENWGVLKPNADGNIYEYANGGLNAYGNAFTGPGIYPGGADVHKFAERETNWEAYISGKPDARERNVGVWMQAGERLGMWDARPSVQEAPMIAGDVNISSATVDGAMDKLSWTMRKIDRGGRG